jgi:HD-GYP domain-containing protein (c-di-GMP phosphodiesterase class II)
MTSDRPYRQTITFDTALEQLNLHAGTQFDATIVDAFCKQIALHTAVESRLEMAQILRERLGLLEE